MTVDKDEVLSEIGRPVTAVAERWSNGTTWHPRVWTGNVSDLDPLVECFEVSWDEHGKPTITGNTAQMRSRECLKTQRLHDFEEDAL